MKIIQKLSFFTGTTSSGTSGSVAVDTGDATNGKGGAMLLTVGSGNSAAGGIMTMTAGETTADNQAGGSITIIGPWA